MPSRRDFLQSAAVLSASPLAGKVVFAEGRQVARLDAVVVDSRHVESRTFGLRAEQWGAPVRRMDGDVTALWQHELLGRWRSGPAAVAGLTERSALFVLERLAWDHGLRVVFEAEHAPDGRGYASHRVVRSSNPALEGQLKTAGAGWSAVLADHLLATDGVVSRNFEPTDAAMAAHRDEATKLYSWIIAPRTAA